MSDHCTHASPSEGQYPHHDWRLWSREWVNGKWQETWYCTQCRLVDERFAEETT